MHVAILSLYYCIPFYTIAVYIKLKVNNSISVVHNGIQAHYYCYLEKSYVDYVYLYFKGH